MGMPAARMGDMHVCPAVNPGPVPHVGGPISGPCVPTVLTCKMPQAVIGDMAVCVGPPDVVAKGSSGVLVGKRPAARLGDSCAHGGTIVVGAPTVLIGESKGGGGGGGGGAGVPGMPKQGQGSGNANGTAEATDTKNEAGDALKTRDGGTSEARQLSESEVQVEALKNASDTGAPFCEACERARQAEEAAAKAREEAAQNQRSLSQDMKAKLGDSFGPSQGGSSSSGGLDGLSAKDATTGGSPAFSPSGGSNDLMAHEVSHVSQSGGGTSGSGGDAAAAQAAQKASKPGGSKK